MKNLIKLVFDFFRLLFKSKRGLILENLMLRQQLTIYQRKDKKPKIENLYRIMLVWISKLFSNWKSALIVAILTVPFQAPFRPEGQLWELKSSISSVFLYTGKHLKVSLNLMPHTVPFLLTSNSLKKIHLGV